jgi:hypothetical protein
MILDPRWVKNGFAHRHAWKLATNAPVSPFDLNLLMVAGGNNLALSSGNFT